MATPPLPPQPNYQQVIVPPAPQAAPGYPTAPSQVYAQPTSTSNTAVKIILIVVGVIVFFGILAAAVISFGAYKLSKAVHRASNGDVSFSTPNGTVTTGGNALISSADLGLPGYPGAKRSPGGMRMKTPTGSLITATFTTPDAVSTVAEFYKSKMGADASAIETGNGTMLTSGQNTADKAVVTITDQSGLTRITIVHTTHPQ